VTAMTATTTRAETANGLPYVTRSSALSAVRPIPRRGVKAVDRSGNNQGV